MQSNIQKLDFAQHNTKQQSETSENEADAGNYDLQANEKIPGGNSSNQKPYIKPKNNKTNYADLEALSIESENKTIKRKNTNTQNNFYRKPNESNTSEGTFLLLTALTTIGLGLLLWPLNRFNKKIALYAMDNRRKAVYIIGAAHFCIAFTALFAGRNLYDLGFRTSDFTADILGLSACASVILYPVRKVKSGFFKPTFIRKKIATLFVVLSSLALFTNMGIRTAGDYSYSKPVSYLYSTYDKYFEAEEKVPLNDQKAASPYSSNQKNDGGQIAATVLLILLGILALMVIIVLSCLLVCSDMLAMAALVGVGGFILLIYVMVVSIRRIWEY